MTKSKYIVRNATLVPFSESAGFDGLTLYTEDFPTQMDSASHWSGSQSNKLGFSMWPYRDTKYLIYSFLPRDYAIIFSDSYADSSNDLTYLLKWNYTSVHNINFKIYDITDKAHPQKIKFGFAENTDQQRDTLSIEDVIILSNANGSMVYGKVDFSTDSTALVPKLGDTLYLFTKKGLSILDTIIVSGKITGVQTSTKSTVESYALMQNYPNPFNPSTVIRYDIPIAGKVTLKVYNIIGKEVATLVHSDQAAGSHSVQFNAAQFSSGVYFYTLHAGDYFQTKKMLLIK
jgi:hypothetical protein